jgi:hypothetical protein
MDNNSGSNDKKPSLSWSQPATTATSAAAAKPAAKTASAAAASNDKSNMSAYVGIFVAGIVIGALLGWGISASKSGTSSTATSTPNGATSQNGNNVDLTGSAIGSSLVVAATQTAGMSVSVTNVSVAEPTWVVVYEDVNGKPGSVIGAELFFPPSMKGKTASDIELVRPTIAGNTYYVGQSVDDGDKSYSSKNERKLVGSDGSLLLSKFTAN